MKKMLMIIGVIVSFILIGLGIYGLLASDSLNNVQTNDSLKESLENIKSAKRFTMIMSTESNVSTENIEMFLRANLETNESETSVSMSGILLMHDYDVLEDGQMVTYSSVPMLGINDWYRTPATTSNITNDADNTIDVLIQNIDYFEKENDVFKAVFPKESLSDNISLSLTQIKLLSSYAHCAQYDIPANANGHIVNSSFEKCDT